MRRGRLIILLAALMLAGCRNLRTVPVTVTSGDSVRTETHRIVSLVKDTVWTAIPAQRAERETRDTASYLENDYAESRAWITDGLLHHTLATKAQKVPHEIQKPVERTDSIVCRDRVRVQEKPVEVERPLTWWQELRLTSWPLLALFVVAFAIKLIKR